MIKEWVRERTRPRRAGACTPLYIFTMFAGPGLHGGACQPPAAPAARVAGIATGSRFSGPVWGRQHAATKPVSPFLKRRLTRALAAPPPAAGARQEQEALESRREG